jgi:hypothetical protein
MDVERVGYGLGSGLVRVFAAVASLKLGHGSCC